MAEFSFKLPDIGEGVVEAEIVEWHIAPGDHVEQDAIVADVMTDKATVEITSPVTGRIVAVGCEAGQTLPVGGELILFDVNDAIDVSADASEFERGVSGTEKTHGAEAAAFPETDKTQSREEPAGNAPVDRARRPLASPAVRRRAHEEGVDLARIKGSGPSGRIRHHDLDRYQSHSSAKLTNALKCRTGVTEVKVMGLRRKIADQMSASKRHIPHFSYIEEVDVTELERLRRRLNEGHAAERAKLTLLPFLIKAMSVSLRSWPECNATYDDDREIVTQHAGIHVGIGTQTDQGILVPVVRHAEALGLWECATEIKRLSTGAREGKLPVGDLKGSTITITSLGALGGIATTPVINRPEVAIVGVNKIVERPVVRDGQIEVRKMMNLSSSFDHRVVDGFNAANWIQQIKARLEVPETLFVE